MKKLVLASLATVFFSGCYNLKKDNLFIIRGTIQNSSGAAVVIQAKEGYEICVNVDYSRIKNNATIDSNTTQSCTSLSTDPEGNFQVTRNISIGIFEQEKITINNAKLFLSKKVNASSADRYVFPVTLETINLTDKGGELKVKATVF